MNLELQRIKDENQIKKKIKEIFPRFKIRGKYDISV